MIPLQLNLLQSDSNRCTSACQTLVHRDHASYGLTIKGESLGLHRKGEEANAAQTGGFLFKASWSGFILQEFFYLSEFGQHSPQQVLTGTTSWRSRKALVPKKSCKL
ncbi:Sparc-Like Protein 1 [Manis pentadactyla]|nr:Sparc-Like Protein 1 [Manis pentadactyla]